jgi:hypothetical protein
MTENDAEYFVNCIGSGVAEALKTCSFFLGVETEIYKNADVHPEYVTTVEVAKKLTGIDRYVSLETQMKDIRREAGGLARLRNLTDKAKWEDIKLTLSRYKCGKKDSKRIDIVVRPSTSDQPPFLIAEAKLGAGNTKGIIKDIERVMELLKMFHELGLLDQRSLVYGAVLFHSAKEGGDNKAAKTAAKKLLAAVNEHLSTLRAQHNWLYAKAGLLSQHAYHQPIQGYWEQHSQNPGDGELVFAKTSFTFAPGLVLLSHQADVDALVF